MGRRAPVVADCSEVDAVEERTNALRAERRAHILAEGADGHVDVDERRDDCPVCPVTRAATAARRRYAARMAR
jgi:hypothetical protein